MSVYLFGSTGMLGSYIQKLINVKIFLKNDYNLTNIDYNSLEKLLENVKMNDIIINCAGIIPQRKDTNKKNYYLVNTIFPILLSQICEKKSIKLIHITTDCIYNGDIGNYTEIDISSEENDYGMSKYLGEFIKGTIIRTSIIGEEDRNKYSLLEWVKSNKNNIIDGYDSHYWNGITCYQLAIIIKRIINENLFWDGVRHLFSPIIVSKYELVTIINDIYKLNIKINKIKTDKTINKTLSTIYDTNNIFQIPDISKQIEEQKNFLNKIKTNKIITKTLSTIYDTNNIFQIPDISKQIEEQKNFLNEKTVMTISGIRPDFIRMSEIFKKLDINFNHILVHTGQHYDELLSDVFFKELNIRKPDYILNTGKDGGTQYGQLSYLTNSIINLIKDNNLKPNIILFLGDSNTVCAALPLRKEGYIIGHIEAGMRSFDKRMLEEINRTICDHCSHIHFVYHEDYKKYLFNENIKDNVNVVGNTIVEVCKPFIPNEIKKKNLILVDIHRPENFKYKERMKNILNYANYCGEKYNLPVKILKFNRTFNYINEFNLDLGNIEIVNLMAYKEYLYTIYHAFFIISDSGTAQEEPAIFNTPVIVPRDFTERPQSVDNNCSFMLDVNNNLNFNKSFEWINLLENNKIKMNIEWLGNGNTSDIIISKLKEYLYN